MITVHELKTDSAMWAAIAFGKKTAEVRLDDRGFKVGDFLVLNRTPPDPAAPQMHKAGDRPNEAICRISHIVKDSYGLREGYALLSFRLMSRSFMELKLKSSPS